MSHSGSLLLPTVSVAFCSLYLFFFLSWKQDKGKGNRVRMESVEGSEDSSRPGELLPDPLITLKEHNTKNNKSGIVFYSREQREDLCFTEQEHFPRITDLLSGIRSDRKMQASAQVMGKKS